MNVFRYVGSPQRFQSWLVVKRHWRPAAAVGSAIVLLSAMMASKQPPNYEANGKLLYALQTKTTSGVEEGLIPGTPALTPLPEPLPGDLLQQQVQSLQSQALKQQVISYLKIKDATGRSPTPPEFFEQLEVSAAEEFSAVSIAFSSGNRQLSAAVVNALMDLHINSEARTVSPSLGGQVQVKGTKWAKPPELLNGYSAAIKVLGLGLAAGLGAFFSTVVWLEKNLGKPKSVAGLQQFYDGCELLELLPKSRLSLRKAKAISGPFKKPVLDRKAKATLVMRDQPDSLESEVYRSLQAKIWPVRDFATAEAKQPGKIVTIVSAIPNTATAVEAANIALAAAEAKKKTLLIEGDLAYPHQAQLWALPDTASGLSNVLQKTCTLKDALKPVSSCLWVLPSRSRLQAMPVQTVPSAEALQTLLRAVVRHFDAVVIDSPPLLETSAAVRLGRLSDGVVIVSALGKVPLAHLQATRQALRNSRLNILGLVVANAKLRKKAQRKSRRSVAPHGSSIQSSTVQNSSSPVSTQTLQENPAPKRSTGKKARIFPFKRKTSGPAEYTSADFAREEGSRASPVIQIEAKVTEETDTFLDD